MDRTTAATAERAEYPRWRDAVSPAAQREQARADALAAVAGERAAVEERFAADWGFALPDSLFTYRAFLHACGPLETEVLHDLDLAPYGIMDLFDAPGREPRDGVDVRVHGRYYRDPPEFLTFMHGGSDGLHYGLWYDDGRTSSGVVSYYNNDGGGVGLPAGTPLEAVRERLERHWRDITDARYVDPDGRDVYGTLPGEPEWAQRRHRVRLLREVLMAFDTGDRPEEGAAYHERHRPSPELFAHGHPDRAETLDGAGALAPGDTVAPRGRQRPYDDHAFCSQLRKELCEDAAAREARTAEALRACAAGHPAEALALGRDLHWLSGVGEGFQTAAGELLAAAYRALDRPALAAIAGAHHRHRDLPTVDALRAE
ncbi:ADP-ribosylation family protein [Streptomyces sp. NPDC050560]|uniref:ADP-ribosylation family protein n=1 Tax=Streptomyces sp. NPDC050560 TaxID=3365630 RepID=UPI0037BD3596